MATLPEVFDVDDDGISHVLQPNPPQDVRARVEFAVKRCPTEAISIEDD